MADPDYIFMDGFDHYHSDTDSSLVLNSLGLMDQQYSNASIFSWRATPPLTGSTGFGMIFAHGTTSGGQYAATVTFPSNYARSIGGITVLTQTGGAAMPGLRFGDTTTAQVSLGFDNTTGKIYAYRGTLPNNGSSSTLLGTSPETLTAGSTHCIEWDITFHSSAGIIKIWIDGALSFSLTGQNTIATANAYFNTFGLAVGKVNGVNAQMTIDHLYCYCYTASGGSETPHLTNPIIYTDFPSSDDTSDFVPLATILGSQEMRTTSVVGGFGTNQMYLRAFTPSTNVTLNNVNIMGNVTSSTAKNKAVLYANSGGAPGALIASGTEVVAQTGSTQLTLSFATGQALTAGTTYWIGFMCDTNTGYRIAYTGAPNNTYRKATTYASGAPDPAGAATATEVSFWMWCGCTNAVDNFASVNHTYPTTASYTASATVGNKDLFGFPTLTVSTSAIYCVAVRTNFSKTDGGARTANIKLKSGATTSNGNISGINPSLSAAFYTSYYVKDPDTGVTWTQTALNSAKGGYEIAS